jgi:acetate CoA/acetoacetate CoA-transferase beta subunit
LTADLVATEMTVIGCPGGRATLLETGPRVSVGQVVAATEAKLVLPEKIPPMQI